MRAPLQPGVVLIRELVVNGSMLVPSLGSDLPVFAELPPVLATAYLVAFTEATCAELVRPHLGANQRTVGTRIELSHIAATPRGMTVVADVELIEIEGRRLKFKLACRDEAGPIGAGFHDRAIVDVGAFTEKLARKEAQSALSRRAAVPSLRRASP